MKLGGQDVALLDAADKFDAIVRGGHDNRCVSGIDIVRVDKIELLITI